MIGIETNFRSFWEWPIYTGLTVFCFLKPLFFAMNIFSAFFSAALIQVSFRLDFIMGANIMNPG